MKNISKYLFLFLGLGILALTMTTATFAPNGVAYNVTQNANAGLESMADWSAVISVVCLVMTIVALLGLAANTVWFKRVINILKKILIIPFGWLIGKIVRTTWAVIDWLIKEISVATLNQMTVTQVLDEYGLTTLIGLGIILAIWRIYKNYTKISKEKRKKELNNVKGKKEEAFKFKGRKKE